MSRWKANLTLTLMIILSILPVAPLIGILIYKGNPQVVYVESELISPEEMKYLMPGNNVIDSEFILNVKLMATKQHASVVTGTLFFATNLKDAKFIDTNPNQNLTISQDTTSWSNLEIGVAKNPDQPFEILGLNYISEPINFVLELICSNHNGLYKYSRTVTFALTLEQTSVEIVDVRLSTNIFNATSSRFEIPKGRTVPIDVTIRNTGTTSIPLILLLIQCNSVEAGSDSTTINGMSVYGWSGVSYSNVYGAITLTDTKIFQDSILPGQVVVYHTNLDYKNYWNGALNVGRWHITEVIVKALNTDTEVFTTSSSTSHSINQEINDESNFEINSVFDFLFNVVPNVEGSTPVFIYFVWNKEGETSWEENPRKYFDGPHNFGRSPGGLFKFNGEYSNYPDVIDFDMTICTEDDSWILPEGEEYQYHHAEIDSASRHVGEKLKMMGYDWSFVSAIASGYPSMVITGATNIWNCGFDILLVLSGRDNLDYMGLKYYNVASVSKSGLSTSTFDWRVNIDQCVQHEISHIFGTCDYLGNTNGHPEPLMIYNFTSEDFDWDNPCVMVYPQSVSDFLNGFPDGVHERLRIYGYNHWVTTDWCYDCAYEVFANTRYMFNWVTTSSLF
ncbi:MAG: hypothetical protein ACTSP5_01130 [Candidatus Heimdallarchaeota archaeon]